jgi:cytochrome b561
LLLAALVLLHVAGAVKHQFIDRDGLIDRMRPGRG